MAVRCFTGLPSTIECRLYAVCWRKGQIRTQLEGCSSPLLCTGPLELDNSPALHCLFRLEWDILISKFFPEIFSLFIDCISYLLQNRFLPSSCPLMKQVFCLILMHLYSLQLHYCSSEKLASWRKIKLLMHFRKALEPTFGMHRAMRPFTWLCRAITLISLPICSRNSTIAGTSRIIVVRFSWNLYEKLSERIWGMTPTMWCAYRSFSMFPMRLFVRGGANLNMKEHLQSNTAMHIAAAEKNVYAIR